MSSEVEIAKPVRSMLFVPGNQDRLIRSAARSDADVVVLDCEDSVPVVHKKATLAGIADSAKQFASEVVVRLNPLDPHLSAADLQALANPQVSGLVIPEVHTVEQLVDVDSRLADVDRDRGSTLARYILIESALGVRNSYDLATSGRAVAGAIFGGGHGGDLIADLGCTPTPGGLELLYARSKVLLDLRAAGLSVVLDGVYFDVDDLEGYEADTSFSRRLGYNGRCVIHPMQIGPANALYQPSRDQREWAAGVARAAAEGAERGLGAVRFEGQLVDAATVRIAHQILEREGIFSE